MLCTAHHAHVLSGCTQDTEEGIEKLPPHLLLCKYIHSMQEYCARLYTLKTKGLVTLLWDTKLPDCLQGLWHISHSTLIKLQQLEINRKWQSIIPVTSAH